MAADTPLSDYASYVIFFGTTPPGTQAQYEAIIAALSKAIRKKLSSNITECSYSSVMNSPLTEIAILPQGPVCADSLIVYQNYQARGNPNSFTQDNVLTPFVDYILDTDNGDQSVSTSRIVTSLKGPWGARGKWSVGQLGFDYASTLGTMRADYTAGYSEVPDDITMAVNLSVSKVYNMRERGGMLTSESLNGYSYGLAQQAAMVLGDPVIWDLLAHYQSPTSIIG